MLARIGNIAEKFLVIRNVQCNDVPRGQSHRIHMDGKVRRRHDGRVARSHQGEAHVREALLGTQASHDLRFGVEPYAVLLQILAGHFPPQVHNAIRFAIAVIAWIMGGFAQFCNHVGRGWIRRVPHPQINHIAAGSPLLVQQVVDAAKHIRWQSEHAPRHSPGRLPGNRCHSFHSSFLYPATGWFPMRPGSGQLPQRPCWRCGPTHPTATRIRPPRMGRISLTKHTPLRFRKRVRGTPQHAGEGHRGPDDAISRRSTALRKSHRIEVVRSRRPRDEARRLPRESAHLARRRPDRATSRSNTD